MGWPTESFGGVFKKGSGMKFQKGARYLFTKEYDLEGFMEFASGQGFDFVQLGYEAPLKWVGEISEDRRRRIRALARRLGLPVCVHSVANGVNVAWINSGIRQESLRQIKEAIEFTRDVAAELITVHPGWRDMYGYRYPDEAYALAIDGHGEVADFAASYGIRIGIENMPPGWTSLCVEPQEAKTMVEDIGRENVGLTLDIGHASILGAGAVDEFITALNDRIFIIHMHDNDGKRDQHKALGEGVIDFDQVIGLLVQAGTNAPLCIEAKSPDDLIKGREQLEQILSRLGQDSVALG